MYQVLWKIIFYLEGVYSLWREIENKIFIILEGKGSERNEDIR